MNELDLSQGKMIYERILFLAPLISAGLVLLGTLIGAIIGAQVATWREKRRYKQLYREKILATLEEGLEKFSRFVDYLSTPEKRKSPKAEKYYAEMTEFQDKYPILSTQVKVIDQKLHGFVKDLLSYRPKKPLTELNKEEAEEVTGELGDKVEKCVQRIYEIWTE